VTTYKWWVGDDDSEGCQRLHSTWDGSCGRKIVPHGAHVLFLPVVDGEVPPEARLEKMGMPAESTCSRNHPKGKRLGSPLLPSTSN